MEPSKSSIEDVAEVELSAVHNNWTTADEEVNLENGRELIEDVTKGFIQG